MSLNHEAKIRTPLTETRQPLDVENGCDGPQCSVRDYRKLAVCSIICGLSCVGIVSLIYSVKTRELRKKSSGEATPQAKEYSKKTLKWGIGAIVAWLSLLILIPLLLGLLSYLLTFIN